MRPVSGLACSSAKFRAAIATGICLLGCGRATDEQIAAPAEATFVGAAACAECHAEQYAAWLPSHHARAMQVANTDTVLGDFTSDSFSVRDGRFRVAADNALGEPQEFEVQYTFGVTPLQQYLAELPGGRLQVLPTSWDSRPREQGGQRWFRIYGDAVIDHSDPLHWTKREQNWNYMCAECHSTGLEKNYRADSDTFETSWSEINVACEACHGPGSRHALDPASGFAVDLDDAGGAVWRMNPVSGIAERSQGRRKPLVQPEACGRCHSRRGVITAEYEYGRPLTDTHLPSLLDEHLYYPDGQILDEVYVYGSFVQSKMYRAGVTCSDCHDPHSAGLMASGKATEVCLRCHLPQRFASTGHDHHPEDSVECVDCHMRARLYMVVDPRRDHSFRVPRPSLTLKIGVPNACADCHPERGARWAADAVAAWYGDAGQESVHYGEAIHAGRMARAGANTALLGVIDDQANPAIARATALKLLAPPLADDAAAAIRRELSSPDALVRIGALRALQAIAPEHRGQWGAPLLKDPVRAVRIEAVTALSPARATLRQSYRAAFLGAEREYVAAQLAIAERPEAHINLGNLYVQRGEADRAERAYRYALRKEPRAIGARINLADLYRQLGRDADAERLLREGLEFDTGSAALHHALGLVLVRVERPAEAITELALATELDAAEARYAYVYGVALHSMGRPQQAIDVLEAARRAFPADYDIAWMLATIYRDAGRIDEARKAVRELLDMHPDDRNSRLLLESL